MHVNDGTPRSPLGGAGRGRSQTDQEENKKGQELYTTEPASFSAILMGDSVDGEERSGSYMEGEARREREQSGPGGPPRDWKTEKTEGEGIGGDLSEAPAFVSRPPPVLG